MQVHLSLDYHRQHFAFSYVLPADLGHELRARYPSLGSVAAAKHGLRQWLRLHILAPEHLALPSRAVFLLWHELVGREEFEEFSKHGYGHILDRRPSLGVLRQQPDLSDREGLALTFAMACADEGTDPLHPASPPALFRVDEALGLGDGQCWVLNCGHASCPLAAASGPRCVLHELAPLLPDEVPKEVRFGEPGPFPLEGAHPDYGNNPFSWTGYGWG